MKIKLRTIFKIAAAIYVVVVLIAAVVLGAVSASRTILSCHTARVSEEMFAYWHGQQRYQYIVENATYGGMDTKLFWSAPALDGTDRTHDEVVADRTREYVEYIVAAAYLYDAAGYQLSDSDREDVESIFENKLTFFSGDQAEFNRVAGTYGFDYNAAVNAELMYRKMELLRQYTSANEIQQDAYYKEAYVRVKLAYVLSTDPAYQQKCEMIRLALADTFTPELLESGADSFSAVVTDPAYNADETAREDHPNGYYFSNSSQFALDTYETLPDLVLAALSLKEIGASTELTVTVSPEEGVEETRTYFLRSYDLESLAYTDTQGDNEIFFTDFLSEATDHYFAEWCKSARTDVVWEKEIPAWVPGGHGGDLYKFY